MNWKKLDGFINYEISDTGLIRGPKSTLVPWTHKSGHKYVRLSHAGEKTSCQIHRLVLLTFVGPCPSPKHEACHKDGNPGNNNLGNLYWGTRRENIYDCLKTKDRFPKSALTFSQADSIRKNYTGKWGEKRRLAATWGVTESTIGRILNGRSYIA